MLDTRYVVRYTLEIQSTGLLQIGDGEQDILLDAYSGKPQFPATGIAGAFRNYLTVNACDKKVLKRLFGNVEGEKSRLFPEDGEYLGGELHIEHRERVRIDGRTGTAMDGGKFHVNALPAGQKFRIAFHLEAADETEKEEFCRRLEEAFRGLNSGVIRFGAQKTNGAGSFTIQKAERMEYDLYDSNELEKYLLKKENRKENILPAVQCNSAGENTAQFEIDAKTVTPLLIAGVSANRKDQADKVPVQRADGAYIVPGSSFKGVLRMQCERIADYLNIPMGMVEEIFGSDACKDINHEERSAGKLFAEDAVIRNGKAKTVYNRVAVDKFTGGIRNGAKFDAMPVEGNVRIKVSLVDSDRNRKAHIGLILLALRDIFSERVAIGGGNNVGYGRIRGKEIRVQDGERNCIISMEDWNRSDAAEYVKILLAERTDITGEME